MLAQTVLALSLVVRVYDNVGVANGDMASALAVAHAILKNVGIEVTWQDGRVGQGATFATGGIEFPYAAKLDLDALTMEAFVSPKTLPADAVRMGILDSDARFGLFLIGTKLSCIGAGGTPSALSVAGVPIGTSIRVGGAPHATRS